MTHRVDFAITFIGNETPELVADILLSRLHCEMQTQHDNGRALVGVTSRHQNGALEVRATFRNIPSRNKADRDENVDDYFRRLANMSSTRPSRRSVAEVIGGSVISTDDSEELVCAPVPEEVELTPAYVTDEPVFRPNYRVLWDNAERRTHTPLAARNRIL